MIAPSLIELMIWLFQADQLTPDQIAGIVITWHIFLHNIHNFKSTAKATSVEDICKALPNLYIDFELRLGT